MNRSRQRLLVLIGAVPVMVVVSAVLYMVGMYYLEGSPRTVLQSLEWAAETLSTTGYGKDNAWTHPAMAVFVIFLQFIGVFLIFLVFPIYLIPFLEERFELRLPTEAPAKISGHLIVFRFGPPVETLLDEVESHGLSTVVIEPDPQVARRLVDDGHVVVAGEAAEGVLVRAGLDRARALIVNGTDEENAAAIVGARQRGFEGEILALVEDPAHRQPMKLAGATVAFTPRHILGAALAGRASQRISPAVSGIGELGHSLQVYVIKVQDGSELAGRTLGEARIGENTGANVIGQWVGGELEVQPTADTRIEPGGLMVAVGTEESLESLFRLSGEASARRRSGPFVVGGYGEVGRKVVELLRVVDEDVFVIDIKEGEGIDFSGSVLDPHVLENAGVKDAPALILALDTDASTLFATVIAKDLAPDVPVIARVNKTENLGFIHRAGADFALAISQVAGQMLAHQLLGEESVALDPELKVLKVSARGLEGKGVAELDLRRRTGCSVVAVERGGEPQHDFTGEFRFEEDDQVYICGSTDATHKYVEVFPQ